MNRKGSLPDTIAGPILILVIGITMYLGHYLFNTIASELNGISNDSATNAIIAGMITDIQGAFNTFDYMVPFIIGGLLLVSLIFAYRRGASVVFIGLSLVFWILALMLSAVFTNIFTQFQTEFTTTSPYFPILNWVMSNMKWIVLAWLFLIGVVMFSRTKREDTEIASAERVFMQ